MLKLLKVEAIRTWRQFSLVFMIYFALCFLAGSTFSQFSGILFIALMFLVVGIIFGTFWTIFSNYQKSMFSREGYLTLTLPVSTNQLLISKVLSSMIWVIISAIVLLLGFGLMIILFEGIIPNLQLSSFFDLFTINIKSLEDVLIIVNAFVDLASFIVLVFMCATVAHSSFFKDHRTFWTITIFLGCSFIPAIISLVIPGFENGIASMFSLEGNIYQAVNLMQNMIIFAGMYAITYFSLELKAEVQ